MINNADIEIVVKGYTDKSGRSLYNTKLSEFRANIVKSYLVAKGVSPYKIKPFGMGSVTQIKAGSIEKKEIPARRVEIELDTNNRQQLKNQTTKFTKEHKRMNATLDEPGFSLD